MIESVRSDIPRVVHEKTVEGNWHYCPQCYRIVDPEFSSNCRCCGQALAWRGSSRFAECITNEEAAKRREMAHGHFNVPFDDEKLSEK